MMSLGSFEELLEKLQYFQSGPSEGRYILEEILEELLKLDRDLPKVEEIVLDRVDEIYITKNLLCNCLMYLI